MASVTPRTREEGEANAGHAPSAVRASKSPLQAIGTRFFSLPFCLGHDNGFRHFTGNLPRQQQTEGPVLVFVPRVI